MPFLVWVSETAIGKWVSGSQSLWAYPTILTAHTIGMAVLAGLSSIIALRILGVGRRIPLAPLARLYPLLWVGFGLSAVSGVALFIADPVGKSENPMFWSMLAFVTVATGNMWWLRGRVLHNPPAGDVPLKAKIIAGAMLTFWVGAIVSGRLIAYIGGPE